MDEVKRLENGVKAWQTDDEYRAKPYDEWHRTLSPRLLRYDIDCIEYRHINNKLVAVMVNEITRIDEIEGNIQGYLNAIIYRYEVKSVQAEMARIIADALGVQAYITLFLKDCSRFWVYNLTQKKGWKDFNPDEMEYFLETRKRCDIVNRNRIIKFLDELTNEQRYEILSLYCQDCGTKNPSCRC